MRGGAREGAGRKPTIVKPTKVLLYLSADHKRQLEALAVQWQATGPSEVVRRILDEYDFG